MSILKPATIFGAALLILILPAAADTPVTEDVPIAISGPDLCSGEDVFLSGIAEVSMQIDLDGTSAHLIGHVNEHLTGFGSTSGATYLSDAKAQVTSNTDIDPVTNTGEATILVSASIIGQGNIPNTSEEQLVHITINANGTMTATVDHVRFICQQ